MKRLRMLKVVIQPFYVLDDGETLEEMSGSPTEISAAAWETVVEDLEAARAQREEDLNVA